MHNYWYLATTPLSDPSWDGVVMFEVELEDWRVVAPMLFTARESAEAELRTLREGMPDAYRPKVGEFGESAMNEALNITPEVRVFEIDPRLLREYLENSALTFVMVDDRLRLAQELSEELRR